MNIFIEGLQGSGKSTLLTKFSKAFPDYQVFREGDLSPIELAWCSYMKEDDFQEVLADYPHLESEIRKWTTCEVVEETEKDIDLKAFVYREKTSGKPQCISEAKHYITSYTRILAEERKFYETMEQYEIYNGRVLYEEFRSIILNRYAAFSGEHNVFECSFFQNSIESMMLFYQMSDDEILEFYREAFAILKDKNFLMFYLDSPHVRENTMQIRKERCDHLGNEMWYPLMLNYLKDSPYGKAHHYVGFEDMVSHFERRRKLELRIIREILGDACVILPAKKYEIDVIGMSGSMVILFEDKVLKISDTSAAADREYQVLHWLNGKASVPIVHYYTVKGDKSCLLMSRLEGEMACDGQYMQQPELLLEVLTEGLRMLWNLEIEGCPIGNRLEQKLQMARYNVEHGLVDVENTEPETFGEGGFRDPEDLLEWLESNQPDEDLVYTHGDYCLPNVLVKDEHVSGLIDLGRGGVADRWQDIALCCRSLLHNADGTYGGEQYPGYENIVERFLKKLGVEPDEEKLRYYILLDELF